MIMTKDFSTKSKDYQRKVVQALIEDSHWAERMIEVMDETYFTEAYLSIMVRILFDYHKQYSIFPTLETYLVMLRDNMREGDKALARPIIDFCKYMQLNPLGADKVIIQDQAFKFCKRNALGNAIIDMGKRLDEEDFDAEKIVEKMQKAIHIGEHSDLGHNYTEEFDKRLMVTERSTTPTGYEILDQKEVLNGGIRNGQIAVVMAPSGCGKSMCLVDMSAKLLRMGKNVVYFSLELSDTDVGIRFDANFADIPQHEIREPQNRALVENAFRSECKGKLHIKYFAAYDLTISKMRNYLKRLEVLENWKPDAIVIDYADLMAVGQLGKDAKGYEAQGNNYVSLRAFGQENDLFVLTAVQTNRGGVSKEVLDKDDISEDFKKVMHADIIFGLSRTKEDKMYGFARISMVKNRNGRDGQWYACKLDTATARLEIIQEADSDMMLIKDNPVGSQKRKDAAKARLGKVLEEIDSKKKEGSM